MGTENNDVDAILKKALNSPEEPSPELLHKLKKGEDHPMKNRKFVKPSMAVVAALIAALSISVVAFAAAPVVWRYLDTRVIQGEGFVNHFSVRVAEVADDEELSIFQIEIDSEALAAADGGAVIVEIDGESMVILDNLHFDNIDDALNLLAIDNALTPGFLPDGFMFEQAVFPVNPITHPNEFRAARHMYVDYSNGADNIRFQISAWDSDWGISVFSANQEDILINGNAGAIADGMAVVLIDDVLYMIDGLSLTREELIRVAESLQ